MIVYFTSTGNSRFVADKLAEATHDRAVSLVGLERIELADSERLGIVSPTYFWGLPSVVLDLLGAIPIEGSPSYCYFIATYGSTSGRAPAFARKLLVRRGIEVDATYHVKMPDDWTVIFDLSDPEKVARINKAELPQIERIANQVNAGERGNFAGLGTPVGITAIARLLYVPARVTWNLKVGEECIGCGLCAKRCPVGAIEMRDGRPVWTSKRCAMCLRCLHHCPKFAIQYHGFTRRHGQYQHPEKIEPLESDML